MQLITISYYVTDYEVTHNVYGETESRVALAEPRLASLSIVVPQTSIFWDKVAEDYVRSYSGNSRDDKFQIIGKSYGLVHAIFENTTRLQGG